MKKVVLLLLALSVFSVAKPAKTQPKPSAEKKAKTEVEVKDESPAAEVNAVLETPASDSKPVEQDESLKDSTFALYIHPFNFMVPYSHFWGGLNIPEGFTDYPLFNLTFEWKLMDKISLKKYTNYFIKKARKFLACFILASVTLQVFVYTKRCLPGR